MKVLECSSKGDKRFSAFYAKVDVFGKFDSIENHYQLSKRFVEEGNVVIPENWKEVKGKTPDYFVVNKMPFPIEYLTQYYKLLWVKYLDANPSLVTYASGFDEFNDMFRGKSINNQADVIKQYIKEGRASLLKECRIFSKVLKNGGFVTQVTGDLLTSPEEIRGHQTNCIASMGGGIAYIIQQKYPEVLKEYVTFCNAHNRSRDLLGKCQIVPTHEKGVYIANLFGQYTVSRTEKMTEEKELKKALMLLKEEAKEKQLTVGLPWQLGSGLAGGDWNEVKKIIQEVFYDYPVTIYKLPGL